MARDQIIQKLTFENPTVAASIHPSALPEIIGKISQEFISAGVDQVPSPAQLIIFEIPIIVSPIPPLELTLAPKLVCVEPTLIFIPIFEH